MISVRITENEGNQRLDRFLKKYLENATLGLIYKIIRKDIKVNGKRSKEDTMLQVGDEVSIYLRDEDLAMYTKKREHVKAKKQFTVVYEDPSILIVDKPFGLLTHGDGQEKKNHLANQVVDYLIVRGDYNPRAEKTFTPASVNRLDRNTTGLVLFGKTAPVLQELNRMIREKDKVSKFYLTIVKGRLTKELVLRDKMSKDSATNTVSVLPLDSVDGKVMETIARPIMWSSGYTLVEVEIITGRTHQIRAHLAKSGHPVIGDAKYGDRRTNDEVSRAFGLNTQLLHAYKLRFNECGGTLEYLQGREFTAEPTEDFARIKKTLFDNNTRGKQE